MNQVIAVILATFATVTVSAGEIESPAGSWKAVSDKTGKVESIIQVYKEGTEYKGRILSVMNPKEQTCSKCRGALKDRPIVGLDIMRGLKQDGSEWTGGTIVDPEDGSEYNVKIALANDGKELNVRGFIGFSLFGRTQTWLRDSPDK